MITHNVAISAYGNHGNSVEVVDPKASQVFANDTVNTITMLELRVNSLHKQVDDLEAFIRWCGRHHGEVMDEYTVSTAAKARIHGQEKT